jgi:tetratricopeptide (TPR) repeat protein
MDYGQRPDLLIPSHIDYTDREYLMVNPGVAERYFPKHGFIPRPPHELFLKNKPENGYRIFVMGGSTSAGWPYPNNVLFFRILRQRLADTFPDRNIEIINTSIAAVNSYTLMDFLDEILEHQPDAILIYAGHNEFYGAFGAASTISFGKTRWIVKLYLSLQRFRTVLLLRDFIWNVRNWLGKKSEDQDSRHSTLMSQVIDQKSILEGSPTYERGIRQFEGNLRDILNKARDAGVPVTVSELVSNIRDHKPFVSEGSDRLLPADTVYQQAREFETEKNMDAALKAYYRAKDLDAMRFRASEDINQIIHQVAGESGIPVVPMKEYFEDASPHRLIGNNLILEHLHPNAEGHFIMSEAFFNTMHSNGFVMKQWEESNILPDSYYRQTWGITELDRALGRMRVINLMDHWPFKPESESVGAVKQFKPQSKAETLAQKVYFNIISFRSAHRRMAEYYESQGDYKLAAKEYKALIAANPVDLDSCNAAATMLLKAGQYNLAEPFLYHSLNLSDSGFAHKWIGQIHLSQNNLYKGIQHLERALHYLPDDPQILFNLGRAYVLIGDFEKARPSVAHLEKVDPRFPEIDTLKQMLPHQ